MSPMNKNDYVKKQNYHFYVCTSTCSTILYIHTWNRSRMIFIICLAICMYEVKYIHYGIVFIADEEHRFRIYVIYYM